MDTHDPSDPGLRFSVHHVAERHQWQVIDREGRKGQYPAVIAELDDRYPTSRKAIERCCRRLNTDQRNENTRTRMRQSYVCLPVARCRRRTHIALPGVW